MTVRAPHALCCALALAWAAPGRAAEASSAGSKEAKAPPAEAARRGADESRAAPRVRASHRVDVIAPGERVQSVIDRLRVDRPDRQPPENRGPGGPGSLRRPDSKGETDRPSPDGPGMPNQTGPPARSDAPGSDRPRR